MIVGLTGRKQAGKNAVAKKLAVWSPLEVVEVSYAAKLKQSVAALLGCTLEEIETWKNDPNMVVSVGLKVEEIGIITKREQSFREFLQHYGDESHRRIFGYDFWLDAALPLGGEFYEALHVVTDCRYPNEAQRIRDLGGIVVRVVGPPEVEDSVDGHASETPLPDELIDREILNTKRDDSYAQLDYEVRKLLRDLTTTATHMYRHSTLCAITASGHRGPCTCGSTKE